MFGILIRRTKGKINKFSFTKGFEFNDHCAWKRPRRVNFKKAVEEHLQKKGIKTIDAGTYDEVSCDYPDYAQAVCKAVLSGEADYGILVCGTGIGMSIAANKMRGIRCALLGDVFSAKATRAHNDANVMALENASSAKAMRWKSSMRF